MRMRISNWKGFNLLLESRKTEDEAKRILGARGLDVPVVMQSLMDWDTSQDKKNLATMAALFAISIC